MRYNNIELYIVIITCGNPSKTLFKYSNIKYTDYKIT